jgi:sphinganine C4-monooxygenase
VALQCAPLPLVRCPALMMAETFHSRHHRLYVPYAFGALYNHPFEGLLMDTIGAGLGYKLSGMGLRAGMVFFSFSTMKTVDDHCGYALPWDPMQKIFWNNAGYHDVHHQSWGIKVRFLQSPPPCGARHRLIGRRRITHSHS